MRNRILLSGMILSVLLLAAQVHAESVSISPPQDASLQGFNLTTQGTSDWLKWADSNASTVYRKGNGAGMIGSFIRTDSNDFSNDFDPLPADNAHTGFSWTDGNSSLPATSGAQYGSVIFDPDPSGSTFGTTFQFSVFPGAGSGSLRFWGMSYGADAELAVALMNASNQVLASDSNFDFTNPGGFSGLNFASAYYDIPFSGLKNGDKLVLQYSVASDNGDDIDGHGYIGLMAAALNVTAPTPEPGTLALAAMAGAALLLRRRSTCHRPIGR